MSVTNDPDFFFQTADAIAISDRKLAKSKNNHGAPIKLPSKLLAVLPAQGSQQIYTAQAAGQISLVDLNTNAVTNLRCPAQAPLTCLDVCSQNQTLYTGCWDKHIYGIPLSATSTTKPSILRGHTDFIKCVLVAVLGTTPILLSGSADSTIIVWNLSTNTIIHKLKGHNKAVQALAIDPTSYSTASNHEIESFTVFSSSSNPEIRQWHISLNKAHEINEPILVHETSVSALVFDGDGDLWTASADKTARHLVRDRNWQADTVLQHPDFVRDIAVVEQRGLVVTACRDEEVRVWDSATGQLICTYTGHFEEVVGLTLIEDDVISVSIDGTIRTWPLDRVKMKKFLEDVEKEKSGKVEEPVKTSMLTAEEEAELAELMDSDDD